MKIIKFGGKSLSNEKGLPRALSIIKSRQNFDSIIVVSARGNTTNQLEVLLEQAKNNLDYKQLWEEFKQYQLQPCPDIDFSTEFTLLQKILEGVRMVGEYSLKIKDLVLAQGEIVSAKMFTQLLQKEGIQSVFVDSRNLLVSNDRFGNAHPMETLSQRKTNEWFATRPLHKLPVITGFIAATKQGETTTLGRNGSNYSAALLARFLQADEVINYTHVNGIYTANPDLVEEARIISHLNYHDASELAGFGTSVLHAKTLQPLVESRIPLRIVNTFEPDKPGTLINQEPTPNGVKSIAVQHKISLICVEGRGLLGKKGIDARIFNTMEKEGISVGLISQGSSEKSISFIVDETVSRRAIHALEEAFQSEMLLQDVSAIWQKKEIAVLTVVGQNLRNFTAAYQSLIRNNIEIILINNTISGNNLSLVVDTKQVNKAVNLIHAQIFGVAKKINVAVFGKGKVGGSLINQILKSQADILRRKGIRLNIFAVVGTERILFSKNGIHTNWETAYEMSPVRNQSVNQIIDFVRAHHFENLVAIDNTASASFVSNYFPLVENGFDLISSNKIANTVKLDFYRSLRLKLKANKKQYLYETNVGAGLPLIDTIRLLHESGENITRIRGVFSGSLSYLFNTFSVQDVPFHQVLQAAIDKGFTEPDPREDLSGNDVARKLLILARELDLENEFEEVKVENLIPAESRGATASEFLNNLDKLDVFFNQRKAAQKSGFVLRYVADLHGDLQQQKGLLDVGLVSVSESSALGRVSGSDSIFEIYTESYGDNPIIIQGAGAGAEVTARGVFGDLLRIADKK